MRQARYFVFEPFRLDVLDERLWQGGKSLPLSHKALALLQRLVSQPDQLVTKDDLFAAAWPDTAVSEAVLTTAIREIRHALGDPARTPQFIQTVHGRGYRFIAPVSTVAKTSVEPMAHPLVGRETEWARLDEWYTTVQQGARRIGLIAGEAGIGKTALVEAFVSEAKSRRKVLIGHGQCVEHYGAGEAYLPILEALGRLGRDTSAPVATTLREHAPSWLAHLPSLRHGEQHETPAPVTPARMLRELADALEVLTARAPLILVLEDLHWSDTATLEWLRYTVRRRDPARLLVLGTYRPVEAVLRNQALRNLAAELRPHPHCAEIVLDYLSGDAVEEYVRQRCGNIPRLHELVDVLRRRTGGHPLFLTTIVDELMRQQAQDGAEERGFAAGDPIACAKLIPASVRQFIEHRVHIVSGQDQSILEAASVAGDPFCVSAVAAATAMPEDTIEARCAGWSGEGQFLTADGTMTWPDGTVSARYRFRHALYPEVVYAGISPERRVRFHREVGDRLEGAYRKRTAIIAAELAMHFEQARDPRRAVPHLRQAARNALQRSAYSEAHRHLDSAQRLLAALPDGRDRLRQELEILLLLGRVLMTTKGWARDEVEQLYLRARELSEQLGDTPCLLQTLWGMICVSFVRADIRQTQLLGREVLKLANQVRDPVYGILGHMELGGTAFHLGESTAATAKHFRQAEALYNPRQHPTHVARFGADMGLFSRSWATHYLWHAGYADKARASAGETLNLARELSHPFSQAIALAYAAMLHQFCLDIEGVDALAEATITLCTEHGFPYYLAWAEVLRGWTRAAQGSSEEGIAGIRSGIEVLQATAGARLSYYRALLAESCARAGRSDEALQALADAWGDIQRTQECWWESELHRLRGEILGSEPIKHCAEAEACFHKAIDVARSQHATTLEMRAALSLGRLWRAEGKEADARLLVAERYEWFTEGFDAPDLQNAKAFLDELASRV
ncbi:MAG: AAA family ATPase [Bryobacteraceae bacterium]